MSQILNSKSCFLDTGVFYRFTEQLRRLIDEGYSFYINGIVYYEFINTLESEITNAELKKNIKRKKLLIALKDRFSGLLTQLDIILLDIPITWDKTPVFFQRMNEYKMNIGDILILETILTYKIDLLVTTDDDWKRTRIKSIII